MAITIGIDIGGSQTKIIGVDAEGIKSPMLVKADDPITSLFGAFGKYFNILTKTCTVFLPIMPMSSLPMV